MAVALRLRFGESLAWLPTDVYKRQGETHAAADDGHGVALDLGGLAQRAGDVADEVALVEFGEALRGLAHHHEDELDPALLLSLIHI